MLNRQELEKYKTITGLHLGQIERDYLQHLILMLLFRIIDAHLVFKGGTALHKAYGLNRFSEDLDFNVCKEANIRKVMQKISQNISLFGYENSFDISKQETGQTVRLKIKGPLYDGQEKSLLYLWIEISAREKIIIKSETKEIKPIYEDLLPYLIKVMAPKEIFAEKVRAVLTRDAARDVFDLHFLLTKNVMPDFKLISRKLKFYKKSFDFKKFKIAIDEKELLWKKDLSKLVLRLPDFDEVKQKILSAFKEKL